MRAPALGLAPLADSPPRRRNHLPIVAGMPLRFPLAAPERPVAPLRPTLAALAAFALAACLAFAASVHADTIPVKTANLRVEEGDVLLNAEFELTLNSTLEEALQNGIPLYFTLEFELFRARWYWLDEKLSQTALTYRVSYNAFTRQYRVASGLLSQTLNSVEEIERYVGRVTSRPVARADALTKGARYDAAVRLRLDVNQLPKPFQVNALASREWTLASDWYRWTFAP